MIQARDATVLEPCRVSGSRRIGGARQGGSDSVCLKLWGEGVQQGELGAVRHPGLCGRAGHDPRRGFPIIAQGWMDGCSPRICSCSRVEDG